MEREGTREHDVLQQHQAQPVSLLLMSVVPFPRHRDMVQLKICVGGNAVKDDDNIVAAEDGSGSSAIVGAMPLPLPPSNESSICHPFRR